MPYRRVYVRVMLNPGIQAKGTERVPTLHLAETETTVVIADAAEAWHCVDLWWEWLTAFFYRRWQL